jgi:hypothetical protein
MNCGCGKTLGRRNTSGRCALCALAELNADPEHQAKRLAGIKRKFEDDPAYAAAARERCRRVGLKAGQDPELRARRVEAGRERYANILSRPDIREKAIASIKARVGAKLRARALSWCPEYLWPEYQYLRKVKRLPAAEAREIVLQEHARREAALSPFERQMRALEKGAKLVATDARPSLSNPGNYGERRWG